MHEVTNALIEYDNWLPDKSMLIPRKAMENAYEMANTPIDCRIGNLEIVRPPEVLALSVDCRIGGRIGTPAGMQESKMKKAPLAGAFFDGLFSPRGSESSHMCGMRSFDSVPTCSGWGFSHIERFRPLRMTIRGSGRGFIWEIRYVFCN